MALDPARCSFDDSVLTITTGHFVDFNTRYGDVLFADEFKDGTGVSYCISEYSMVTESVKIVIVINDISYLSVTGSSNLCHRFI